MVHADKVELRAGEIDVRADEVHPLGMDDARFRVRLFGNDKIVDRRFKRARVHAEA